MTWSYPVLGPSRSIARVYGCPCGDSIRVTEATDDHETSSRARDTVEAFRKAHERCPIPVAVEAP